METSCIKVKAPTFNVLLPQTEFLKINSSTFTNH